jgi:hypothetical protein
MCLTQQINLYNVATTTAISNTEGYDINDKNCKTTVKKLHFMLDYFLKDKV